MKKAVEKAQRADVEMKERLNTLAAEINTIKTQTKQIMMAASVEIGKRLVEAKAAVGHGGWETWLQENVDYSQRTASNLIKIYEEYGVGQEVLFGKSVNSQALADLSYTQAVALLGIKNPDERADFIESHDVSSMSSRELEKAIKERDKLKKKLSALEEDHKEKEAEIEELRKSSDMRGKLEAELAATKGKLKEAEDAVEAAKAQPIETAVIEKVPDEVQRELDSLRAEVKRVKEQPVLDAEVQKMRLTFAALFERVQKDWNDMTDVIQSMDDEDRTKYKSVMHKLAQAMATECVDSENG